VAMAMFGGFSARNESDERGGAGRCDLELHCVRGKTGFGVGQIKE
jgi:hypothetical protein